MNNSSLLSFVVTIMVVLANFSLCHGITRHYRFDIRAHNVTHLCKTKSIITVNGQFPGPTIVAREGDQLLIKVVNHVQNNVTIHWHGIRQRGSQWADGPSYITQCPIQSNQSYVYNYTINGQRGTLFWHAHISWLRATIHGPILIFPMKNASYPFPKPTKEKVIIFGEWWNNDTEAIVAQALQTGGGPNVSDAYTFNGHPGPLYNSCTGPKGMVDTYKLKVKPGRTYLLRLINAALNDDLFFAIANHTITVVEADALYIKPFETETLLITPGQTTNVLLKTKPKPSHTTYLMGLRPYFVGSGTFDNTTSSAILEYTLPSPSHGPKTVTSRDLPRLPSINDTSFFTNFTGRFRSLNTAEFPATVPQTVDKHIFLTVGLGTTPCPKNQTCQGPSNTTKFSASINNISMTLPSTSLLQSHYSGQNSGVFTTDFPQSPVIPFNYTGTPPNNTNVINGTRTKVIVLPYNTSVELVLQDTSIVSAESHPLHLHGYNVYVVGQGFGNFNSSKDPIKYNLIDPVERNTVAVPAGGWVALRFRADNPGVWFMHCHFEVHISWGLRMAWVVQDGKLPNQKVPPPPADLPKC